MSPMEREGSSIQNMAIKQQITKRMICVNTKIQGLIAGNRH